ncbi:MAG: hypothetical protein ABIK89_19975 [Planctomycetota bacterium]
MLRNRAALLFSAALLTFGLMCILEPAGTILARETLSRSEGGKQAVEEGVVVWDTGRPYKTRGRAFAALEDQSTWDRLPVDADKDYRFKGDCVVENRHLWLYLPVSDGKGAFLRAKTAGGAPREIALHEYDMEGRRSEGTKSVRILRNHPQEVVVEYGARSPQKKTVMVGYHLAAGRHWVEAEPRENAGRLAVGSRSQQVVVPSEFGEDFICDSSKLKPDSKVSLPRDNMAIAFSGDGSFMSVMTYPSVDQAGDISISSDDEAAGQHGKPVSLSITEVSAAFQGKSIFVGLLPHQNNWHYEPIKKIYSASGQYISDWKPAYPGVWRLAGHVRGKYRVNDARGDRFVFACSWSGTFDHLFMYLYARTEDTPAEIVTPTDVYREALGSGPNAYLLETEGLEGVRQGTRTTKHRDVCGTVNDLKETWKDHPERVEKDPDYVADLTEDAKAIMTRLESRLNEYRRFTKAVAGVDAEMNEKQESAENTEFTGGVGTCCEKLENVKMSRYAYGCGTADEIKRIAKEQPERLKTDREHLDRLAEQVRAVAQFQEDTLKVYRSAAVLLSGLCQERREAGQEELKHDVTAIGRLCRGVLRNRDPEE